MIHRMLWKKGVLSLRCHASSLLLDHRMSGARKGVLSCAVMHASCVMIHRMLWWKKVCYPAAMQARCCCDSQNALVKEGVLSLRCHACKLLSCDPQNALVEEGCAIPALPCIRCCCDSQNALVEEGCAIPAPCKLAAVVIHRMLWWKKGVLSCAVMHASCCHDPQNALVEEGCAIPALPCKLALL
jgi:hypothetical protein